MTISGNINIICNDDNTIKSICIYDNNHSLPVEISTSVAAIEAIHNTKQDAHSNLFNTVNAKNQEQDSQISSLSSNKADRSELPVVNNATLTITQGGATKGTFGANASSDVTIALDSGNAVWGNITGELSEQTDLNTTLWNKANTDLSNCTKPHIIDTYLNGTSWYRIYSDGWCEMGGIFAIGRTSSPTQVTLLKTLADTNYVVTVTANPSSIEWVDMVNAQITSKTVSSFNATDNVSNNNCMWRACGYLASGQY